MNFKGLLFIELASIHCNTVFHMIQYANFTMW